MEKVKTAIEGWTRGNKIVLGLFVVVGKMFRNVIYIFNLNLPVEFAI